MVMTAKENVAANGSSPRKLVGGMRDSQKQTPTAVHTRAPRIHRAMPVQPGPFVSKNLDDPPFGGVLPVLGARVEPPQGDHRVAGGVDQTMGAFVVSENEVLGDVARQSSQGGFQMGDRLRIVDQVAREDEQLGSVGDHPIDAVAGELGSDLSHEMDIGEVSDAHSHEGRVEVVEIDAFDIRFQVHDLVARDGQACACHRAGDPGWISSMQVPFEALVERAISILGDGEDGAVGQPLRPDPGEKCEDDSEIDEGAYRPAAVEIRLLEMVP